ncbi:hypothetical protein BDP55DRAFT_650491 [Colletotrichum godetiae]|uniref:Secreted protein n=1 Tax=Colletotrichum godetiae TaxID=1209918 RepID=A0AAJ0AWZ5_9PEZI|nr:uncharacterized protein BDP55DRAFT_650491 [Colletotrichum godetiae]KAK1690380.1 hypothetical protein BDP55DRAFT_650491 [Colletotrichum godetiae]
MTLRERWLVMYLYAGLYLTSPSCANQQNANRFMRVQDKNSRANVSATHHEMMYSNPRFCILFMATRIPTIWDGVSSVLKGRKEGEICRAPRTVRHRVGPDRPSFTR